MMDIIWIEEDEASHARDVKKLKSYLAEQLKNDEVFAAVRHCKLDETDKSNQAFMILIDVIEVLRDELIAWAEEIWTVVEGDCGPPNNGKPFSPAPPAGVPAKSPGVKEGAAVFYPSSWSSNSSSGG